MHTVYPYKILHTSGRCAMGQSIVSENCSTITVTELLIMCPLSSSQPFIASVVFPVQSLETNAIKITFCCQRNAAFLSYLFNIQHIFNAVLLNNSSSL